MSQDPESMTATTRARYDRLAPIYDLMQWFSERRAFNDWRKELWTRIAAGRVLEVGVGTGKNLPFYPRAAKVTAIDLSPRMLERAKRTAARLSQNVDLRLMDAQDLKFADATFDAAVATFVFCSAPLPVRGMQEHGVSTRVTNSCRHG